MSACAAVVAHRNDANAYRSGDNQDALLYFRACILCPYTVQCEERCGEIFS
jgi:hypothetical protein